MNTLKTAATALGITLATTFAYAEQNSGNAWNVGNAWDNQREHLTIPAEPGATCSETTKRIFAIDMLLGPDENGYDPVHPKCDRNGTALFTDASSAGLSLGGRDLFKNPEFGLRREDMPKLTPDDP